MRISDSISLVEARLPGVMIRPQSFRPTFEKHAGKLCHGVVLHVTDPQLFRPVTTYLTLLALARQQAPAAFEFLSRAYEFETTIPAFDLLTGSDLARKALLEGAVKPALVAVMLANNETGVIQPIRKIAPMVREAGGLLLVDAAQALGRIPVDIADLDATYLVVSSHKAGGPQGAGALALAPGAPFRIARGGGGQERGRRPGTENVAAIAGFDSPAWNVGVNFSYPLGMRAARANYARAQLSMQQSLAQLKAQELSVSTEVINAGLAVENTYKQYEASQKSRQAAERNAEAQVTRFEVGMATNFEVVQAQQTLTQSRLNELSALIRYMNAVAEFERVQKVGR